MATRQLKIKTGVVKRYHKEHGYYLKEAEKQRQHIAKMESDGKDPYDIKKQREVLDETLMMIPDTKQRLEQAWKEWEALMKDPSVEGTEELEAALTLRGEIDLPVD